MLTKELLFNFIGGLGFFFFGMQLMSDGLKKVSGEKLKSFLHSATKIPLMGILIGAFVTCLVQSSSATTVMVVGFVNAGLLTLKQSISIIIGANIGTTVTAWLVSFMSVFKITSYSLPSIAIGLLLMKFGKTRKMRSFGQVVLGFGLLFTGLSFMKDAFAPLKSSQELKDIFVVFSHNPIMGVFVGLLFTVLLQSSSATIAIVQVLAFSGVISFESAIPIILGDNIGTTVTAQLAALETNITARRTAMAHTLFNVIGSVYMLVLIYLGIFSKAIQWIVPGEITSNNIMFHIAIFHTFFNVLNAIVFMPFIGWLEKISITLVPSKPGDIDETTSLEKHILETPSIALEQVVKETIKMLSLANRSLTLSVKSFFNFDVSNLKKIDKMEELINNRQTEITQYIIELSKKNISEDANSQLPVLIHIVNDIERIGDHAQNISELAERSVEQKVKFKEQTLLVLNDMWQELILMMSETENMLKNNDIQSAQKVLKYEDRIDQYQIELKEKHMEQLKKAERDLSLWLLFIGFVDNLEKIGDHLSNIAQGVLRDMMWQKDEKKEKE